MKRERKTISSIMNSKGCIGTKQQLIALVDDIDIITRQLFETLSLQNVRQTESQAATDSQKTATAPQKMDADQLTELLLQKNQEFEKKMNTAREQQRLNRQIEAMKVEIAQKNKEIECLQKHLKDAEHLLSTALYQAKEKLKSIKKARAGSIPSEEIIRYAHKISAACATAAPLNWAPGDPRRPYPQDIEMRCGLLGQLSNQVGPNAGDSNLKPPTQLGTEGLTVPNLVGTGLSAQSGQMLSHWGLQGGHDGSASDVKLSSGKKGDEDVEVMSSDSSSSSSSDSSFVND